ncbi:Sugar nucleotide epimerase YfcH,-like putative [Ostreococcus tauri]|uniref:Sugar nucleotide epimerase YfcH,-like putative n=1 Tax=Ostreococcus tauri TaxID=70448 RepID=A0A090M1B6_OSTTA|nr:Sugar nucleotide epimerase YfcH,-like putative [Ostreococcus tauri]CEF97981.1 Sugar nucleotide epimerase YfcH,-like putative [Ostreococcus tauri]|eukprot:XP_022839007.1 Sugar nucleotide epimerase YfcH,-like putative [Ostreococcus tauri]
MTIANTLSRGAAGAPSHARGSRRGPATRTDKTRVQRPFRFARASPTRVNASASEDGTSSTTPERLVVAVTGATGFVGSKLVETLLRSGAEVRVLTRDVSKAKSKLSARGMPRGDVAFVPPEKWRRGILGATHVVNLAGEPISTRWDPRVKGEIMASRVKTTKTIVDHVNSISDESKRPKVLVNASAIGYYGTSETDTYDEASGPGADYLSQVCQAWEQAATGAQGCRVVILRLGIVLDRDGGALGKMVPTFQAFMGGPLGDGQQWFSWIHRDDAVGLIMEGLTNEKLVGPVNCVAPTPVRMREMCESLGETLGKPSWLPVPDFALRAVLGEGSTLVLQGQRIQPKTALEVGYKFKYERIDQALKQILNR